MGIDPGKYFIVNYDRDGYDFAVEYGGKNSPVFVRETRNIPSQKWIVSGDKNKPQSIFPVPAQNLYLGPETTGAVVQPMDAKYSWSILERDGGYMLQDENQLLWSLNAVQEGQRVVLRKIEEAQNQTWAFIKT